MLYCNFALSAIKRKIIKKVFQLLNMKVLLHVSGEIGTKGKNRIEFERKLAQNIRKKLKNALIKRSFGSFLLEIENKDKEKLKKIPGIAWISEVKESEKNLESLLNKTLELARERNLKEFDIEVKRAWKGFQYNSQEIRNKAIKMLKEKGLAFKPRSNKIFIEINKDWFAVFSEKEKGVCGLPTSMSGKAIVLISGGIDSAVASFLAMKKGLEVIFVHFHNYPSNDYKIIDEKLIRLIEKLSDYQIKSKVYIISFVRAQQEIIKNVDARFRMIFYRYLMFQIAQEIAKKEGAKVIISGDSLGQVASQTLENLSLIIKAIKTPILMPLIAYDKSEIIEIAKRIETYEITIVPYADCCSFMIAKSPATKMKEDVFKKIAKKINMKRIVKECLKKHTKEIMNEV